MKGNISLNKLSKITRKKRKELAEEIKSDIELSQYDAARAKIDTAEEIHEIWLSVIRELKIIK